MGACPHTIADLLPHQPPMVLLDAVTRWSPGRLEAVVEIRPSSRFFQPGSGVPAHVGIEYMAQACGAYAGLEAKESGQPIRIGFLLGTRNYASQVSWFTAGERLTISVIEILRQGPMGVFDCCISSANRNIASARLNVYQSSDMPSDSE
jgi:predicted hotdog family 3-hydroxylacyl-ACP dehydratase